MAVHRALMFAKSFGPALLLFAVCGALAAGGKLFRTQSPALTTSSSLKFNDIVDGQVASGAIRLSVMSRRLPPVPTKSLSELAVVGRRLVVAAKGQVYASDLDTPDGWDALIDTEEATRDALARATKQLVPNGQDSVWVVDFYGLLSLIDVRHRLARPLRVLNVGHNVRGVVPGRVEFLVHRSAPGTLLSTARLTGNRSSGTSLMLGSCCADVIVEEAAVTAAMARPPIDTTEPDIAQYLNRAAVATYEGYSALAFLSDARIHLYDPNGRLLHAVAGPQQIRLDFAIREYLDTGQLGYRPTSETRFAYIGVAATETLILALYSGRDYGTFGAEDIFSGDQVHVFDWNGKLQAIARLEEPVRAVAVDALGGRLYGISGSQTREIVEFDVSTLGLGASRRLSMYRDVGAGFSVADIREGLIAGEQR